MQTGAITSYIDVAQVVLYAFWLFFAGLIIYLRREDKREGYPLESDVGDGIISHGFLPTMPKPKTFRLLHGGTASAPSFKADSRPILARPIAAWPGAPLEPTGNPMVDGVGPAAYANRADVPDLTLEGQPKIVPLRVATDFWVESRDPDPRGMAVVGADGLVAGVVSDVWVDRSEILIRYLEVEITEPAGGGVVLLPMPFARIDKRRGQVRVKSILTDQFIDVPKLRDANQVTFLEEDRICAYYGGGTLYADPSRLGPML